MQTKKMIVRKNLARAALLGVVLASFAAQGVVLFPSIGFAQSTTGKGGKTESGKKPGESCESLDHDSKAFKDCVKKQAQGNKSTDKDKGKSKNTDQSKDTDKGKDKGKSTQQQ